MGHEVTATGLRPDPKKVQAIKEMPIPQDKAALQRILEPLSGAHEMQLPLAIAAYHRGILA